MRRKNSMRLKGYDYSDHGIYFITISINNNINLFGEKNNGAIILNEIGGIVEKTWLWIEQRYNHVNLDEFVIMPDHLHGVIVLQKNETVSTKSLGGLIGAFKTVSTRKINEMQKTPGEKLWQRSYYEHIVRNENDLNRIRQYIKENPSRL